MGNQKSKATDLNFSREDILVTAEVLKRIESSSNEKRKQTECEKSESNPKPPEENSSTYYMQDLNNIKREYNKRLDLLEEKTLSNLNLAAAEFTSTVERLENKYMKPTPVACCSATQQRFEDCFNKNQKQLLNCSLQFDEYLRCVAQHRKTFAKNRQAAGGF